MVKVKKQKYSWDKTLLIPGTILTIGSSIFAYLFSPIGCKLLPPAIKPNTLYLWDPCDVTDFWAFWVIFILIAAVGASLITQSVKLTTKK